MCDLAEDSDALEAMAEEFNPGVKIDTLRPTSHLEDSDSSKSGDCSHGSRSGRSRSGSMMSKGVQERRRSRLLSTGNNQANIESHVMTEAEAK